jgi:hypothetical protein
LIEKRIGSMECANVADAARGRVDEVRAQVHVIGRVVRVDPGAGGELALDLRPEPPARSVDLVAPARARVFEIRTPRETRRLPWRDEKDFAGMYAGSRAFSRPASGGTSPAAATA